jgi:hemoglobin-like flavoprotein
MSTTGSARSPKDPKKSAAPTSQASRSVDVFVSYSHKDTFWKDWLLHERPTSTLVGTIEVWSDDEIHPSDDWRKEIETALLEAQVAVLLVSKHFTKSPFISNDELPQILEQRQKKGARILWIPLDKCNETQEFLKKTKLADIQAAWPPEKPLEELRLQDLPELLEAARTRIIANVEAELDRSGAKLRKVLNEKYEVVRRIGAGKSRTLFLARDHGVKRWVAITALNENEDLAEFERSLIDASTVDNIEGFIAIHEARLHANPPHCVLQYIEGETLATQLEHGRMQFSYVHQVLLRLSIAVAKAHDLRFFHLNIKPSNVLVDQNDRAFLSPLSRTQNYYDRLKRNWASDPKGEEDKAYAIPEFFGRAVPRADYAKCDQYLLGLLGYHMITGKLPQRVPKATTPASPEDFIDVKPINEVPDCQACPELLAGSIMRMLARNPEDRFDTLQDAIERLALFRDESLELARDSYRRIAATPGWESDLMKSFYDDLRKQCANPAIFLKFNEQAWQRQYEMLKEAVLLLLVFCEVGAVHLPGPTVLSRVKGKHSQLDIAESDFELFGKLLIENLVKHDPLCLQHDHLHETIMRAWKKSLSPGMKFMKLHMSHRTD